MVATTAVRRASCFPTTHADTAYAGQSRALSYVGLLTACAEGLRVHRDDATPPNSPDRRRQRKTRFVEDRMQRALTLLVLVLVSPGSADRAIAQAKLTKAQKIVDAMKAAPLHFGEGDHHGLACDRGRED